jgi:hypothetical protein
MVFNPPQVDLTGLFFLLVVNAATAVGRGLYHATAQTAGTFGEFR